MTQTVALPHDPALNQVLSALSAEGAQALVDFMRDFQQRNG